MRKNPLSQATPSDGSKIRTTAENGIDGGNLGENNHSFWQNVAAGLLITVAAGVVSGVLSKRRPQPDNSPISSAETSEAMEESEPVVLEKDQEPPNPEDQKEEEVPSHRGTTIRDYLVRARDILENVTGNDDGATDSIQEAQANIDDALAVYDAPLSRRLFRNWAPLLYIGLAGLAQILFIELYCRWHGAYFLSLDLYNPTNVEKLSKITFVNGPTTMSIAAEVLMWSSLGVWARAAYEIGRNLSTREAHPQFDVASYIGTMVRNTAVAAVVVIILRLTKFSIFGVSLDSTSPLAFDATVGIAFILGFFGDEAFQVISNLRDRIVGDIIKGGSEEQENASH